MSDTAPQNDEYQPLENLLAEDIYYSDDRVTLVLGHAELVLSGMPAASVDCVVTSPPYFGLRDYDEGDQLGLEDSPKEYVENLLCVLREVRRVLKPRGTFWLNIGDSYYSGKGKPTGIDAKQPARRGFLRVLDRPGATWAKPKDLLGIPWRVAFALQDEGWYLRNDIIWSKPNAMPSSVQDRLSNRYEHVFLLSPSRMYDFNLDAIREPLKYPGAADGTRIFGGKNRTGRIGATERTTGSAYGESFYPDGMTPQDAMGPTGKRHLRGHRKGKNPGDVWTMSTRPHKGNHPAMFPVDLPARCIAAAGVPSGGVILDPFSGSGTTGLAALAAGHQYIGIDLSAEYHDLAVKRLCGQRELALPGTARNAEPTE